MGNTTKLSLPTRIEFRNCLRTDQRVLMVIILEEKKRCFRKSNLEKYNVDKLEDLINFSGIVMQEDEEYGNMVWDKHFGDLYSKLEKQRVIINLVALLTLLLQYKISAWVARVLICFIIWIS